jgi:hypothetical protein
MTEGWAEFWRGGGGCLPQAAGGTAGLLARCWQDFAAPLARKAELLDLATGDGAVLKTVRAARPDLRLLGVDRAPRLPAAPPGIKLRAGVRMEALPFPAGRFAAVTSQFGFEYGEIGAIAREVARVLAASGRFRFVVHHRSSLLLAHNQARRAGLRWAVEDSELLQQARALVRARARAALPTPERFRQAPAEARQLDAGGGVAAEIATAVLQTLDLGRARPSELSLGALDDLERKARGEIARIDALVAAARDEPAIAEIEHALRAAGLHLQTRAELRETPGAPPLAWLLSGGG